MIEVTQVDDGDPLNFEVIIRDDDRETHYRVTMRKRDHTRLTAGKYTPEHCVEASFRFLLDRESKDSILRRFELTTISRYFPEFERELPRYLSQS